MAEVGHHDKSCRRILLSRFNPCLRLGGKRTVRRRAAACRCGDGWGSSGYDDGDCLLAGWKQLPLVSREFCLNSLPTHTPHATPIPPQRARFLEYLPDRRYYLSQLLDV
jgi:hypothetical protein